jgi:hypothetical protein
VLPAAVAACAAACWSCGSARPRDALPGGRWRASAVTGLAVALVTAATFYTSFFTAPSAILEPFRGAGTYLSRGLDPASHLHPWYYYLRLLAYTSSGGFTWSEGLVLVLAVVGAAAGWRQRDGSCPDAAFWTRYLACDVVIAGGVLSLVPYKTPWNLLPFYVVAFPLAGSGFAALVEMPRSRAMRGAVAAALTIAALQLGQQAWRAAVTYAADPRNPYVYAQTVPDAVRMAARIRDLSSHHELGQRMQVSVIASPYEQWPLPWYLRTMPNVGYWTAPSDPVALQAPVVVASLENAAILDQALGDRYVSEFYGLRPDVVQALYVERGLWNRLLAQVK